MRKSDAIRDLLATERLVRLVVEDELTRPIREYIERRWPESRASYLVSCRACVSVWAGLLVSSRMLPRPVLSALALSSAVLIVDRQDERIGQTVAAYRRGRMVS